MKKMLALVLALAMCLGCVALAEETALVYALGAPMPDFTFTDSTSVSAANTAATRHLLSSATSSA